MLLHAGRARAILTAEVLFEVKSMEDSFHLSPFAVKIKDRPSSSPWLGSVTMMTGFDADSSSGER